jgi:PKD repeat protein
MKQILLLIYILTSTSFFAQKNDHVWIIGGNSRNIFNNGFQWGTAIADFKQEPVRFLYDSTITMDLQGTNGIISDNDGNLLMYSNGMHVHNKYHTDIKGLDTISYSKHWENFNSKNYQPDGSDWKSGLPGRQWIIMLPDPADSSYLIFHPLYEITNGPSYISKLLVSKVSFTDSLNKGIVSYRDKPVRTGTFQWGLNAIKHGNGRDWWLVHGTIFSKTMDLYLIDKKGIKFHSSFDDITRSTLRYSYLQGYFSPRGDHYVTAEGFDLTDTLTLTIYTFDRCIGKFNKIDSKKYSKRGILFGALSFSPDGKYLYTTNGDKLYQYDMDANNIIDSEQIAAVYDGTIDTYYDNELIFSSMVTGPDGRIYCIPAGNTRSIHTIEYPEELGSDALVLQNSIALPIQNFNSLPNFPNFRIGSWDGSTCDTLGIDNIPVAKFRYEQDTSNHLRLRFTDLSYFRPKSWLWDFGDGHTFDGRKPYWHEFSQPGTYNVCLTVSNENSSNTTCRTITLGTSSSDDESVSRADITLFPNPVQDYLLITLGEYVPAFGQVMIYDVTGRPVITQRIYYGQNSVDMSALSAGVYVWKVMDGKMEIKEGKVVKI